MTREERSIKYIKSYEPKDGYKLGFSGGKDSIVADHLFRRAGVSYERVFNFTSIDPPNLLKYIRKYYPKTTWLYPGKTMFQWIVERDLPRRICRVCCRKNKVCHQQR